MNKIFYRELTMEDHKKECGGKESQAVMELEETVHYYEKYLYRTLKYVEKAE